MPPARFSARALVALLSLGVIAVGFGLLLFLVEDRWRPLLRVDEGARDDLHRYALDHPGFVTAMKIMSDVGSAFVYIPLFAVIALWLARQGRRRPAVFVAVALIGGSLLNGLVKALVHRARPVLPNPVAHANGLSFPSGHAQSAVVATSVLLLVLLPRLRTTGARAAAVVLGVAFVVAIGFSRVALGVHFVSDVLAGYALGAAWVAALLAIGGPRYDPASRLNAPAASASSAAPRAGRGDDGDRAALPQPAARRDR
jgi:undecaprenyl-diphosphatase